MGFEVGTGSTDDMFSMHCEALFGVDLSLHIVGTKLGIQALAPKLNQGKAFFIVSGCNDKFYTFTAT